MAVTGPALDDESDEAEFDDEFGGDEPSELPWHNSTRAVVGASAAGIAVIGVLVAAVVFMTGGQDSQSPRRLRRPVVLRDRGRELGDDHDRRPSPVPRRFPPPRSTGLPPPPTTSGSSDTSTSGSESSGTPTFTRPPRTREADEGPDGPTSRRPRFNITRTLGPGPIG